MHKVRNACFSIVIIAFSASPATTQEFDLKDWSRGLEVEDRVIDINDLMIYPVGRPSVGGGCGADALCRPPDVEDEAIDMNNLMIYPLGRPSVGGGCGVDELCMPHDFEDGMTASPNSLSEASADSKSENNCDQRCLENGGAEGAKESASHFVENVIPNVIRGMIDVEKPQPPIESVRQTMRDAVKAGVEKDNRVYGECLDNCNK